MNNKKPLVGIIMGSDSDLPVMNEALKILEDFNIPTETLIVSAHRTPEKLYEYAKNSESRGVKVIIAGAGGSAHLPGMTASMTVLPVIGVPIKTKSLDGLDSLLSIVQMPPGIPVASVAINGAKNAGILAAEILGVNDERLKKTLSEYKKNMMETVEGKSKNLEEIGSLEYLKKVKK